jgi:hypothetical protein
MANETFGRSNRDAPPHRHRHRTRTPWAWGWWRWRGRARAGYFFPAPTLFSGGWRAVAGPGRHPGRGAGGAPKRHMECSRELVSLSPTHNRARSGNPGKETPAVCGRRIDSAPCKGAFAVRGPVFAPVLGLWGGIGRAGARALRWGAGGRGGAGRWAKKCPTLRVSGRVWARGRPRAEPARGRKAAPAACGGGLRCGNAT